MRLGNVGASVKSYQLWSRTSTARKYADRSRADCRSADQPSSDAWHAPKKNMPTINSPIATKGPSIRLANDSSSADPVSAPHKSPQRDNRAKTKMIYSSKNLRFF